jgi:protein ImuB
MYGGIHWEGALPSRTALLELAREFTPRVEAKGATPVLLDLRGLGRVWPSPESLGRALQESARERALEPSIALAFSRVAALVLARGRTGLTVVAPGREAESLAPLPLSLLDLAPERLELFRRWGLTTLGELAALPARGLAERLGPEGPRLRRLARGVDDLPLVPLPPAERFECALDLDWPVDGLEPLSFLLARVLEPLCASLEARGRRAAAMDLELRLVDGRVHRRALKPAAPSAAARTWRTLLLLDLEAHPPGEAIHAIAVRAEPTPSRSVQFSLLDPAQPSPERLAETLGRLQEWTGAGRGGSPSLLETHRPGAFAMASFAPGALGAEPTRAGASRAARDGLRVSRASGARRLARACLRVFRPPLPARVALSDGAPAFVSAGSIRGAVADRAGPWRTSGDWWDVAWSRDEWDVAVAGAAYRIYHDRLRRQWFVEGELD